MVTIGESLPTGDPGSAALGGGVGPGWRVGACPGGSGCGVKFPGLLGTGRTGRDGCAGGIGWEGGAGLLGCTGAGVWAGARPGKFKPTIRPIIVSVRRECVFLFFISVSVLVVCLVASCEPGFHRAWGAPARGLAPAALERLKP